MTQRGQPVGRRVEFGRGRRGVDTPVVVVSNRLPVALGRAPNGRLDVARGQGGLVSALEPFVTASGGRWIGWPGVAEEDVGRSSVEGALADYPRLRPVSLSRREIEDYYERFANSVLWPLFHGLTGRCEFSAGGFEAYRRVNRRFADTVYDSLSGEGEVVWIHDYHLINVAARLRERRSHARLGFFLHTPFPTLDDFVKLPWRGELLRGLLAHDVIGFQAQRDLRRFLSCVTALAREVAVHEGGAGEASLEFGGRTASAGVYPIGIDPAPLARPAGEGGAARAAERIRAAAGHRTLYLGVDRLDYTKGLLERLRAYELALERHPELVENVVYVQVAVPSRENVPAYAALKRELERRVGQISGRFATPTWDPLRYLYTSVSPDELLALYREADVALVTPLCDGMNLVAKEYCAAKVGEDGVLVLSEMAGAANQLQAGALLVNPYDEVGMANALSRARSMPRGERASRMRRLRDAVFAEDVHWWGEAFLSSLLQGESAPDATFEYLPTIELDLGGARRAPGL